MQDGSYQKGQGVYIATNSYTYEECKFLALIITKKYNLKTSVIKSGKPNQPGFRRPSLRTLSSPPLLSLGGATRGGAFGQRVAVINMKRIYA
jgi:LAGLIDADG DNA endonuclease family